MKRDRVYWWALLASLLIHLSAVTLFRIVIFFPKEEVDYRTFHIVRENPSATTHSGERLRLPGHDDTSPPDIELPTIAFANLERLRIREKGLAVRSEIQGLIAPKPKDSWARFSGELGRLPERLTRLTLRHRDEDELSPEPAARPADGFVMRLTWTTGPPNRQIRFAPTIDALNNAEDFDGLITLLITVDPEGRVTEVQTPDLDTAGLATSAARVVTTQYLFDPLTDVSVGDQHGVLTISREGGRE